MAEVAEEDHVITACSSLVIAASLGAAGLLWDDHSIFY